MKPKVFPLFLLCAGLCSFWIGGDGRCAWGSESPDTESSTRYYYHDQDRPKVAQATPPAKHSTNSANTKAIADPPKPSQPGVQPAKPSPPSTAKPAKVITYAPRTLPIPDLTSGEADAMLLGILLRSDSGSNLDPAAISPRFAVDSTVGPSEEQED